MLKKHPLLMSAIYANVPSYTSLARYALYCSAKGGKLKAEG